MYWHDSHHAPTNTNRIITSCSPVQYIAPAFKLVTSTVSVVCRPLHGKVLLYTETLYTMTEIKVMVIGDKGVGKSSVIQRFVKGEFNEVRTNALTL